ncbi:MAG: porin [Bacteroidota bacterium]
MTRVALLCLLFLCTIPHISIAQVAIGDQAELSGLVFSDYYWMAQHHNDNIEGKNGFWFRRVYATYDRDLSNGFSTRLRLEMNSDGDFASSSDMVPYIKDAYLKWQNDRHQILAGISGSPLFGLTEDIWGYRSVEKSPQDLYGFGSSRDFGIAFKGQLTGNGNLNYHLFVGNGNGNKADVDKGKKVSLALSYNLTDAIVVEGYGDVNSRTNNPDSYTGQVFAGYESDELNAGLLYSYQHREGTLGQVAQDLDLVSVFTNVQINERIKGYARADHLFDGYPNGSDNSYLPFAEDVESTFVVAGLDVNLAEQVHLMPNVETIFYGENLLGNTPDTDIIPRLTLFYEF